MQSIKQFGATLVEGTGLHCEVVGFYLTEQAPTFNLSGVSQTDIQSALHIDHRDLTYDGDLEDGEYLIKFMSTKTTDRYVYLVLEDGQITHAWDEWKDKGDDLVMEVPV
jgi:hypothetical protein